MNQDPVLRQELADAHVRATVLALTSDRVLGALRGGGSIGPEASVLKLSLSTLFGRLGGGTEQIQRNLISELALGLPREPAPAERPRKEPS